MFLFLFLSHWFRCNAVFPSVIKTPLDVRTSRILKDKKSSSQSFPDFSIAKIANVYYQYVASLFCYVLNLWGNSPF